MATTLTLHPATCLMSFYKKTPALVRGQPPQVPWALRLMAVAHLVGHPTAGLQKAGHQPVEVLEVESQGAEQGVTVVNTLAAWTHLRTARRSKLTRAASKEDF